MKMNLKGGDMGKGKRLKSKKKELKNALKEHVVDTKKQLKLEARLNLQQLSLKQRCIMAWKILRGRI